MLSLNTKFKQGVIERIPEVYSFAKGDQESLGSDGYQIAITALLGYTPTKWEIDEAFKNQNSLSLQQLTKTVENKLKYIYIEQYICDIFANFDSEYKGYITMKDFHKAWLKSKSKYSWGKLEEAFREIGQEGLLDYSVFQDIITNCK